MGKSKRIMTNPGFFGTKELNNASAEKLSSNFLSAIFSTFSQPTFIFPTHNEMYYIACHLFEN